MEMSSKWIIKKQANEFRDKLNLKPIEPFDTHLFLANNKIHTLFDDISDSFSGMAIKTQGYKFVFVNSHHSIGRQNFTIIHELYHLFIEENFISAICSTEKFEAKPRSEYLADLFAANVLLPENGILQLIPLNEAAKNKISLQTLFKIEQNFQSSRVALLIQLKTIGLIDEKYFNEHKVNISKTAFQLGIDPNLYQPGNSGLIISDYKDKAVKLFENFLISEMNYHHLLNDITDAN